MHVKQTIAARMNESTVQMASFQGFISAYNDCAPRRHRLYARARLMPMLPTMRPEGKCPFCNSHLSLW